ncbi:alpha/beta hydrolase [Pedobacter sp. UYP1]|uniref:RBBP9/YdeN family alpha/beta hydrolase n=1 Tax=Pedobacter sp. UYP1 TaxID=1756396 RepID=UPI003397E24A
METRILIMPGLGGSGENHWQSFWVKSLSNATWLEQENWEEPDLDKWLAQLNATLLKLNGPVILVAHSLAVSLVAHWAVRYSNPNIKGALFVAPADVDSPAHTPDVLRGFAPLPITKLPFPSIVIASENDPYVDLQRAIYFAEQWGSDFVSIGPKGHINSDSELKFWEEGQLILKRLF